MSINTVSSTSAVANYDSTSKTGSTGKNEAQKETSYVSENKNSSNQKDSVEFSDAAINSNKTSIISSQNFKDFDMDAFQGEIRNTLLASIKNFRPDGQLVKYNDDSILYDLSGLKGGDSIKAADVPEYWNAENTSQRIVDFAMSFRELAPELSDEEYINKIREAVELGFKLAKQDLGDLPGSSAKLYNDTYSLTMQKFDELLEQMKAK